MRSAGIRRRRGLLCQICLFLILWIALTPFASLAADWPTTELTAQAGIVMDVDTGAVLFEKNMDARMYPASITKVMTALVVLENCDLNDKVTFSHDAVYNVDTGSSNAQIEEGDVLSVSDCLYALLLKSANEAANALAEHVAGSREAFADMMNQEAAKLGCTGTHFANPSGLFDTNHYTTAHDMALIGAAAMNNKKFLEIEDCTSHKLAATKRVPEGNTVYMEHKMLLRGSPYYDERVIAGKTGYTKDAGNTLITMAKSDGRRLVSVVLADKNPYHYIDTKALLDLGFNQTENQLVKDGIYDKDVIAARLIADTIVSDNCKAADLRVEKKMYVSLPKGSSQDGISYRLQYNLEGSAPADAVARIDYYLDDAVIGKYYIQKEPSISVILRDIPTGTKVAVAATISTFTALMIFGFAVFGGGTLLGIKNIHDDRKLSRRMKEKRAQRLKDMQMTEEEFRELVEKKKQQKSRKKT